MTDAPESATRPARPPEAGAAVSGPGELPRPIADKLRRLHRRIRLILWVRGLLGLFAVALGSVLTIMAVDAGLVIFAEWIRWALSVTSLLLCGLAGWRLLWRPLRRRYDMARIARILEARHPDLQERISSTVEILSGSDADVLRQSRRLVERLAGDAARDAGAVAPEREFTARSAKPYLAAAGAAAAILALLLAVWPREAVLLLARAVAPYARIGNLHALSMDVEPGSARVALGDPLAVRVRVSGRRVERALLRRTLPDGRLAVERMTPLPGAKSGEAIFAFHVPAVEGGFRYRVQAGNALSAFYDVRAVPRPAAKSLTVTCEYPPYTRLPPSASAEPGDIAAPAGSRVTFAAEMPPSVATAAITLDGKDVPAAREERTPEGLLRKSWTVSLTPGLAARWALALKDGDGFASAPADHAIRAVADQAPSIHLSDPAVPQVRLAPDASLPLRYVARDDVAVAAVVMQVEVDGKAIAPRPLTAPAAVPGKPGIWEGAASLDLASLTLGDAKTVTVKLRASDNLPPDLRGPQAGESDPLVIVLDRQAQPLAKQSLDAQEARIRQTLQKAAEQLERAKQTSSDKPAQLADKAAVPEDALRELQQIRDDAGAAGTALDDLARQAEGSAFDRMAEAIRDVPRQDVEPALKDAQMIELVNKPAERVEHAEAMDRHLGQALADVKEALRDLDALDKEVDRLAEMSDMAQRQAQLAGEMQQQQAQNAEAKPDASWQQRQQGVAADAAALARQDAAAQAPSAAAQEQARALAAEIGDLAARQGQLSEALAAAAPAAAAKVAAQQQAIADAAGELAAEAGKLAQAAGSPAPQSAGAPEAANPAAQAAGQMAQAAGKAQQAASSLSGSPQQAGQPSSAAAAKQQMGGAQQAMQQAAQSLAQMAGNTPPAAPASPGGSQPPPGAAALANAASQAAQAAQASQASQAAQSAQASAASLAQAVGAAQKSLGMSPGMPGMPSSLPGQSGGGNMGAAPDGAAEISELGGAGADWFRTAGKLQSDAENAAVENAPPEYRDLVARYFRELARQGEKTEK